MIPETEQDDWTPTVPPFTSETIIENIILSYPEKVIRRIFNELELHCFECAVAPRDTLRDVARLHRVDEERLVRRLSERLDDEKPCEEPTYYDA